jgi:hypothetical protein
MISEMVDLAKQLGNTATYLVLCLIMLVWGARSYLSLRKATSQDFRESVSETIRIVAQLKSAAESSPELEPIKGELLRRLGVVDHRLALSDRHIISESPLDFLLTPEPMLVMGAAGALVMLVVNSLDFFRIDLVTLLGRPVWLYVGLSLLMALAVFKSRRSWLVRLLYYVLVATAVFALAIGLNEIGRAAS